MTVSVIMPARNAEATIGSQLEALSAQTLDGAWELVVVDNGSTDGTVAVVERWRDRLQEVRVVRALDGRGANYARNEGCRAAGGGKLLFCDADDVVVPGWAAGLAAGLASFPAVGGAIERRTLNSPAALAGRPPRFEGLMDTFGFLPYPLTANCGARREVWERLGWFSERYPHGSDDCEFFWRAQLAGYEVGFVPEAVVHYRLRSSPWGMARQYYDYGKSHVRLYQDFAAHGMPASSTGAALAEWGRLAARTFAACRSDRARAAWATRLGLRAGRLVGSIRNRTLYL